MYFAINNLILNLIKMVFVRVVMHFNREKINWSERKKEFLKILGDYKTNKTYDCVIPVSGGKDSTYQVIKLLEYNCNPLCVTAKTDFLTDIGRKNIENIKKLGVDHIEVSTDPILNKINKFSLKTVGYFLGRTITIFTIR